MRGPWQKILAPLALILLVLQACAPTRTSGPPAAGALPAVAAAPGVTRVGLLLPLSGGQAALGRQLFAASQAAFFAAGDGSVVLLPRDTGGTVAGAAAAAQGLASEGVAIVVGPLLSAETRAAAPALRGAGVPLLSFSSDRNVAGANAFVLGLLPEDQVRAALRFARGAGATRIAVLGADTEFGRAAADAARALAMDAALDPPLVALYPPQGDATAAIRRVLVPAPAGRGQPPVQRPDTVLLTDSGQQLRQLMALLAAQPEADLASLRLVGTAPWSADTTLSLDPSLANAIYPAPETGRTEAFARNHASTFGTRPAAVAIVAWDATAVAIEAARGAAGRPVSPAALTTESGFQGAAGRLRLLPDGRNRRQMVIYQLAPDGVRALGFAPFDDQVAQLR